MGNRDRSQRNGLALKLGQRPVGQDINCLQSRKHPHTRRGAVERAIEEVQTRMTIYPGEGPCHLALAF